jgi:hypothetical protein
MTSSSANVGVIRLQAFLEDTEVLILVDLGSPACFINKHLAVPLTGARPLLQTCKVNVVASSQHRVFFRENVKTLCFNTLIDKEEFIYMFENGRNTPYNSTQENGKKLI